MLVNFFAVEVVAYAVMSNHSHFVLWVRPSVAAGWSAGEGARRWLSVCGKRVDGPTEQDMVRAAGDGKKAGEGSLPTGKISTGAGAGRW